MSQQKERVYEVINKLIFTSCWKIPLAVFYSRKHFNIMTGFMIEIILLSSKLTSLTC